MGVKNISSCEKMWSIVDHVSSRALTKQTNKNKIIQKTNKQKNKTKKQNAAIRHQKFTRQSEKQSVTNNNTN